MRPEDITLPAELVPEDGRFGSGPSKVPQEAIRRLAEAAPALLGTSHRRPAVKGQVARLRAALREYFALPDGYEVVLGNGGATLFWDIATHCLVRSRSAHAVFGEFSTKFAQAAASCPFLDAPLLVEAQPGDHPALPEAGDVDAYALTHCETSTGVAMPVDRPGPGLVLVDATSAAGGILFDPAACDAYYFSPQKGFASEGGLWVALLSPQAVERATELGSGGRHIPAMLDLEIAIDNSRQDQTYNTPAIATVFLMAEQAERMNEAGGLAAVAERCASKAAQVYGWAEACDYASPFVVDPAKRSPVVCTVDLTEEIRSADVCAALRTNGIVDVEPYRKLGRNQLRIAVFPAVDPADVERLTAAVDYIAERLTG
jgi:phosphoserine aminotransferase